MRFASRRRKRRPPGEASRPHERLDGLHNAVAVFARLSTPIAFDAADNKPVSDMLVLHVPAHANNSHLKILADVAAMFCERDFRGALSAAGDAASIQRLFANRGLCYKSLHGG
jgi:PTS system nitrogen regulatory IIA component